MYQTEGYAQRSTSLKDNYYVRSGEADQWADKYAERIQKHLDALDKTFTVDVTMLTIPQALETSSTESLPMQSAKRIGMLMAEM